MFCFVSCASPYYLDVCHSLLTTWCLACLLHCTYYDMFVRSNCPFCRCMDTHIHKHVQAHTTHAHTHSHIFTYTLYRLQTHTLIHIRFSLGCSRTCADGFSLGCLRTCADGFAANQYTSQWRYSVVFDSALHAQPAQELVHT
jgi:hypothetical protein